MDEAQTARIAQNVAGIVDPDLAPQRVSRDCFTDEAWHLWNHGRLQQVATASEADLTTVSWEPVHHDSDGCPRRYRLPTGGYHIHWMIKRAADGRVSDMRFHME